ncbi:DUF218 domain-containing protein [Sphingomonas antarctica]|uniref:YdcF family protein n=1 Tax=Sphingomonas antarctica TaxID=2040274 RepID=UPI0039EB9D93
MIARLCGLVLILWALGFVIFAGTLPRPAGPQKTDAIVVPTGGAGRIGRGLALLQAGQAQRMLVTGVDRRVRPTELANIQGAPPALVACCVDLGREAVDTRSNGEETARWIARRKYKSVRLVTTDWHMRRAKFELDQATGGNVEIVTDAVRSNPGFATLLREYDKYLLRRAAALVGL